MFLIVHLNETMGKPAFYNYLGCCIDHLRLMNYFVQSLSVLSVLHWLLHLQDFLFQFGNRDYMFLIFIGKILEQYTLSYLSRRI